VLYKRHITPDSSTANVIEIISELFFSEFFISINFCRKFNLFFQKNKKKRKIKFFIVQNQL
jgi:hypothetical protein